MNEADKLCAEGIAIPAAANALELSEQSSHRWRAQFGGMKADDVGRFEGTRGARAKKSKRIAANMELEIGASRRLRREASEPSHRRHAVLMLHDRLGASEPRACVIAGQHRSTQRREPQRGR